MIDGIKSKDAVDLATSEMRGMNITDNGDTFTDHFTGHVSAAKDGTATFKGTWRFVSGTGKLKGIRGHGRYSGTGNADGSGAVTTEGAYTLVPAPGTPEPPAKPAAK